MAAAEELSPTLCQVVAMVDCYRKLFVVWALLPTITVLSPFVLWCYIFLSNAVTSGQGCVTSLLTFWLVSFIRSLIFAFAPSRQDRDEALIKCRWILPLGSFIFVRISLHFASPILSYLRLGGLLDLSPTIPYVAALQLAGGMALLGFAIVMRMVGPFPIGK
jgi:hypothetical protein